jgi:hypothetical protein
MSVVHPVTGARCWRRRHLPGPALASHHITLGEVLTWLVIALLAPIPLLLWSGFAVWAWAVAAAVLVVTACLLWSDRVIVGPGYVAVRRLLRWHVVAADDLARVTARPSAHGGIVRLDTADGGHLVLHRGELEPRVERALQSLVERDGLRRDERAEELLHLRHDDGRCG